MNRRINIIIVVAFILLVAVLCYLVIRGAPEAIPQERIGQVLSVPTSPQGCAWFKHQDIRYAHIGYYGVRYQHMADDLNKIRPNGITEFSAHELKAAHAVCNSS